MLNRLFLTCVLFLSFCGFLNAQKANDNRFQRTITSIAVDSLEAQRIE